MTTRVTQVMTDASACRCFDASERTGASVSGAVASIRSVILPPSQVAKRVSRIAPVRSRTIFSPLPRAHRPMSGRGVTVKGIVFHHGRNAAGGTARARSGQVAGLDPGPEWPGPRVAQNGPIVALTASRPVGHGPANIRRYAAIAPGKHPAGPHPP